MPTPLGQALVKVPKNTLLRPAISTRSFTTQNVAKGGRSKPSSVQGMDRSRTLLLVLFLALLVSTPAASEALARVSKGLKKMAGMCVVSYFFNWPSSSFKKLKQLGFRKVTCTTTGGFIYGENTCTIFEFPTAITM
jgi:hypothetical protein